MLADYIDEYGEIDPGENPAREVHLPKKTGKRQNVSQTVRTILEVKATPSFLPFFKTFICFSEKKENLATIEVARFFFTWRGREDLNLRGGY